MALQFNFLAKETAFLCSSSHPNLIFTDTGISIASITCLAIDTAKEIESDEEYKKLERQTYIKAPKEISKDLYFEMLGCLPPCHKEGVKGFYMSERISGSYTHNFYQDGNKYFVKIINLKDKTTW